MREDEVETSDDENRVREMKAFGELHVCRVGLRSVGEGTMPLRRRSRLERKTS